MINIQVTASAGDVRAFLVNVTGTLTKRRELNEALAIRLRRELKEHFQVKNYEPNKMNAPKSNFWNQVAAATDIAEVTETGATVSVAEKRFNIQLFGGTILPKTAKFLTIPLIAEARGKFASDYEKDNKRRLFTIPGKRALFEQTNEGTGQYAPNGLKGRVRGKNRSFSVSLAAKTNIRAVYALARKATIKADPTALPRTEDLLAALQEEAADFMNDFNEGRLA